MRDKCNKVQTNGLAQKLIKRSKSIEFFGDRATKKVYYLKEGQTYSFNDLDPAHFCTMHNALMRTKSTKIIINRIAPGDIKRQVELFTYYYYGALDGDPDIKNGELQPHENFRHERECLSLQFTCKKLRIDNQALTPREVQIIDLIYQDYPDKHIRAELGIAQATLTTLKGKLFRKAKVASKVGLIRKAVEQQIPMV